MPGKRLSTEQIVAKLREAEKLQGQGLSIPGVCKKLGISEQTFYRWRLEYGALKEDEAHRLKALERENARLERMRGRAGFGYLDAQGPAAGKLVGPDRRRAAVTYLRRRSRRPAPGLPAGGAGPLHAAVCVRCPRTSRRGWWWR